MKKTRQNDKNNSVYHFEMGRIEEKSSNNNFENAKASRRTTDRKTVLDTVPESNIDVLLEDGSPCRDELTDDADINKNGKPRENESKNATQLGEGNRLRFGIWNGILDRLQRPSWKRFQSSVEPASGGVHKNVHLNDEKEYSQNIPINHEQASNQEIVQTESNITPATLGRCCFVRFIAFILAVIFIMSATSLTLVIMIINGNMAASVEASTARGSAKDAAKPEKLSELSFNFREMQAQISKLNVELENARKELKELKEKDDSRIEDLRKELQEIKNITQERKAVNNITAKESDKVDKVYVELMLNSSQQRIITTLSDMWHSVNTTNKEHREETRSLRLMGNSTQEQIQKVSDSLNKLAAKVRKEEQRLNETIQLKARHSNDMTSLEMLINTSRQDMMNELTQVWTSVNSTGKDLQEHAKASWLAVLTEVNDTKMELQQKMNNISKMAGPIGPPGFNGSQGPAGPAGSIGAPGPKGAGNFSACKYYKAKGSTSGGKSAEALKDEPNGYIIMAATCSTNYALEYNLKSGILSNRRRYVCNCRGDSGHFSPRSGESENCYLHYWLCPIT